MPEKHRNMASRYSKNKQIRLAVSQQMLAVSQNF